MKINGKKYITLEIEETVHETDGAILVNYEGDETWIPKSQLEDWPDVGESGEIIVTEWWAEKEGLI